MRVQPGNVTQRRRQLDCRRFAAGRIHQVVLIRFPNDLGVPLTEVSAERVREKLGALGSTQLSEADVIKLLTELINCGGGVSLELDELRVKLIRREGHFALKEGRTHSSFPPRSSRPR
jgi:hypothetical protein